MSRIRMAATTGLNPIFDLVIFRPYAANLATEMNARGLLTTSYLRVLWFFALVRSRMLMTVALRSKEVATESDIETFYAISKALGSSRRNDTNVTNAHHMAGRTFSLLKARSDCD